MAQATVNFRIDEEIKKSMEAACKDMGLTLTVAFTIFATKVSKERRIPFELRADSDFTKTQSRLENFRALQEEAERNGLSDITMDEVNGIVKDIRREKRGQ